MSKYIDADKLKAHIEAKMEILWDRLPDADKEHPTDIELRDLGMYMALEGLIDDLDSLQQDKESVELELCSQTWWEERGWIMIPPDATIEGIDSLLKQVRKKLQQEQSEVDLDVNKLIAKCREGRDCKAAWEFYTKAKIEEARKEEEE